MTSIKSIWILILLAGIIALIGLITPAAHYSFSSVNFDYNENQWMWGLLYYNLFDYNILSYDYGFEFVVFAPEIFVPGLIITCMLAIVAIISIVSAHNLRVENRSFSGDRRKLITLGILYFSTAVIFIVGMELGFRGYRYRTIGVPISYWENRIPLFGIIAPFISGTLVVAGVIWGIRIQNREEVIRPIGQLGIQHTIVSSTKVSSTAKAVPSPTISSFNYCPECGYKIKVEGSRFCVNCGTVLIP
ncbi:MAG: zinc-ribbon domain-containing protein [Promethearchaeota archaeon]